MDRGTAVEGETIVATPRRRVSVAGVIGEILITVGVVVMLYVVWQMWVGDIIYGAQNNAAAAELSQEWEGSPDPVPLPDASTPAASPDPTLPDAGWEPVVLDEPADAEVFGVMHIPRFGAEYATKIAGGVSRARTLDPIGIGHYPGTEMPGQVGNFALAAHRTTFGAPFARIAELHVGDAIVIETEAGWYTYRFRTLEYVRPSEVDVLADVPQSPNPPGSERYLTMTSCSPKFSLAERIVGYSLFESFRPRTEGPPASLTEGVGA
ncbi:MAG TPA: class E sortase [Microbacterium sp.]|uniref:class E sortase n=1 Tax=Microbacterium sp. TaxID=51671 RepID=UPI002C59F5AD|nr:class E sortase [Microbacterium sp.]HWI32620.1 class E sortase [Microbacterium sp.]